MSCKIFGPHGKCQIGHKHCVSCVQELCDRYEAQLAEEKAQHRTTIRFMGEEIRKCEAETVEAIAKWLASMGRTLDAAGVRAGVWKKDT
jgi:hypothetical protein